MNQVSIMRDITINIIIPATATHNYIPVPPPPVPPAIPPTPAVPYSPAPACAIEPPTNIWWPPGMALGMNKLTTTVIHQGMGIALDGHDCGVLIPHVQVAPAPNNILTALHIAFSSRKSMFCASKVVMNGNSPACCVMFAWFPSPMVYCADPMSPPLADAVTSYLNTVLVDLSLADFLIGLVTIAASMVLDYICSRGDMPGFGEQLMSKLLGGGSIGEVLAKNGIALATGLARLALTDGPVQINLGVGSPYLQLQVGLQRGADEKYSGGVASTVGPVQSQITTAGVQQTVSNPTGSTQRSREWGASGPSTTTTDVSPLEGCRSTTTTTDANGNTKVVDSGGRGGTATASEGQPL